MKGEIVLLVLTLCLYLEVYTYDPETAGQMLEIDSTGVNIPPSLNYQSLGMVTPVKFQAFCGSCWAFAAIAGLESQILFRKGPMVILSEQYTLECAYVIQGGFPSSCAGGVVEQSLNLMASFGALLDKKFPYTSVGYGPSLNAGTTRGICYDTSRVQINITNREFKTKTPKDLRAALVLYGPLVVGIHIPDSFFGYTSGVYYDLQCINATIREHVLLLVGYDQNGNWILKNSWGSTWGDKGYIVISKDADCGLLGKNFGFV